MAGLCACCRKNEACGFRQPGTWVVECGLFEQTSQAGDVTLPPDSFAHEEGSCRDRSAEPKAAPRRRKS
jgi:hypothetical protein